MERIGECAVEGNINLERKIFLQHSSELKEERKKNENFYLVPIVFKDDISENVEER